MKINRVLSVVVFSVAAASLASAQDAQAKAGTRPPLKAQPMKAQQHTGDTYGTDFTSFYRMGASEFTGMEIPGVDDWTDTYYSDSTTYRRYGKIALAYFIGTPHLPSGAKLISIRVNDCVNTAGSLYGDVSACNNFGAACTVLAPIVTAPGCGFDYVDLSSSGFVVDNGPSGPQLVIRLANVNTDGSDSFAGVTVEYQLQVSPAPAVATFADVPTSDFGFQFIEALVASGITGGTGGGLYSPNAFVTRRQMAIFIAKALGLHFP